MKSNLGKNVLPVLVAAGLLFTQSSCSRTEKDTTNTTTTTTNTEGDDAYNNFKSYVTESESDTAYVYDNTKDYNKEIADREAAYNERVTNLDKYASGYDEARRSEIEQMKTRYNTNWETRRSTYASYGKASTMRPQLLTIDQNAKDLSGLTAANIRTSYENFLKQVEANKSTYTNEDWKVVEQAWNDLDNRKNEVQAELSAKDKWEIGKAKTKYLALKNSSKVGNTAESTGSSLKEGTKNVAEKTGEVTKEGASKVGNAAEKTGSAIKETYKKAEDKVDGTKDRK